MTIRDKYYDDKDVDLKGNDITYHVGTFVIDGDISVSGNLTVSGDFPVGDAPLISDSTGLSLVGNNDWQFINDGNVFFWYKDDDDREDEEAMAFGGSIENMSEYTIGSGDSAFDVWHGKVNVYSEREGFNNSDIFPSLFVENGQSSTYKSCLGLSLKNATNSALSESDVFIGFMNSGTMLSKITGYSDSGSGHSGGIEISTDGSLKFSAQGSIKFDSGKVSPIAYRPDNENLSISLDSDTRSELSSRSLFTSKTYEISKYDAAKKVYVVDDIYDTDRTNFGRTLGSLDLNKGGALYANFDLSDAGFGPGSGRIAKEINVMWGPLDSTSTHNHYFSKNDSKIPSGSWLPSSGKNMHYYYSGSTGRLHVWITIGPDGVINRPKYTADVPDRNFITTIFGEDNDISVETYFKFMISISYTKVSN